MIVIWKNGETRDVHEDMARLTLDIVAKTLFGTLLTVEFEEVSTALTTISQRFTGRGGVLFHVPERIPTPANLRFRRAIRRLDEIIYDIIERRRSGGKDIGDLLSMLHRVRDEETGEGMSDRQLRTKY